MNMRGTNFCTQKNGEIVDFGPCFWHDNKVNRKNELCHGQELFVPFSKHSWLLFLGFVSHDWQIKEDEVIFIKILLSFKEILIKITSVCFSCLTWLTNSTNKSLECFENGMNSSCLWNNSFFLLTLLSCQKQEPKLTFLPFFWCKNWYPSCSWHQTQFLWAISDFGYFIIVNAAKLQFSESKVSGLSAQRVRNESRNKIPIFTSCNKIMLWLGILAHMSNMAVLNMCQNYTQFKKWPYFL